MGMQLKRDARPAREYIVEVVGPDGIRHHLGPFRYRREAQHWIDVNTRPRNSGKRRPEAGFVRRRLVQGQFASDQFQLGLGNELA